MRKLFLKDQLRCGQFTPAECGQINWRMHSNQDFKTNYVDSLKEDCLKYFLRKLNARIIMDLKVNLILLENLPDIISETFQFITFQENSGQF